MGSLIAGSVGMTPLNVTAASEDLGFMIKGIFSYKLFGQEVWITTTHVCVLIVMLALIIFAMIANRAIKI